MKRKRIILFMTGGGILAISLAFQGWCGRFPKPGSNEMVGKVKDRTSSPVLLSESDWRFLERCQRRAVDFFLHEADRQTGLVKDRANNFHPDRRTLSSIAATGFGLAALPVAVEHHWISRQDAYQRALTTLRFAYHQMPNVHGWYYHFVNMHTGRRAGRSELSSIDTILFVAGALVAGQYFPDTEVATLADRIYRRIDFNWMRTDGGTKPDELRLCMAWRPETGFSKARWGSYCELMVLYILAMGSPTHPIPAASWTAWRRPIGEYKGYRSFRCSPLFVHQFSHAFIDFRGKRDRLGFNYWQSSVAATLADHQFCQDNAGKFKTFALGLWGLSACDGPDGYRAYGAPPGRVRCDGTVAPWAVAASVPFAPKLCVQTLRRMDTLFHDKLWGRYGFSDALNVDRDWWDQDVIGIDLGAAVLMIENARTGLIWRLFMANPFVQAGMQKAGFHCE